MKIVKGLVVNSISGSNRFTHEGVPLIAVTGAVVFGRAPEQHGMPGENVYFHIAGDPGDGSTAASIGGDFYASGSTNLLDDVFVPNGTLHVGESPEQMRLFINGTTASLQSDQELSFSGSKVHVDASNGRIQFNRNEEEYLFFDMLPGDNDIRIESGGMLILSGSKIVNNSRNGEIVFQDDGQDRLLIDMNTNPNELVIQSNDVLILSGSNVNLNSSSGQFTFASNNIDFLRFDADNNRILPATDNSIDLGSSQFRFANVYTGDLHLRNDRGHWQIVEEADCLTIYNRLTDVRYRFVLERYDA
jgi:hypothetical protein